MLSQNQIIAAIKSDLAANTFLDQWACTLMAESSYGDVPPRWYQWQASSTATADGENVIQPTGVTGAGRWIKSTQQADWNETNADSPNYVRNKPSRSIATASRAFNSSFQISTSRDAFACYSVEIAATLSLTTGQTGTVLLQTSPNNSTWTTQAEMVGGNTGTLTIGLNLTQTSSTVLNCLVPAGYYVQLVTSGTATITYLSGQESLL